MDLFALALLLLLANAKFGSRPNALSLQSMVAFFALFTVPRAGGGLSKLT